MARGVANRERPAIRTLYVTRDGGRAVVLEAPAASDGDAITPTDDWPAVITQSHTAGAPTPAADREAYRTIVAELYEGE